MSDASVVSSLAVAGMNLPKGNVQGRNYADAIALSAFVGGVYVYTMRAVSGSDEIGEAMQRIEKEKALEAAQQKAS